MQKESAFSLSKKYTDYEPVAQQDAALPEAILCDLDGTLALIHNRDPYDAAHCDEDLLNEPVSGVLRNYYNKGYQILWVSLRKLHKNIEFVHKSWILRFIILLLLAQL